MRASAATISGSLASRPSQSSCCQPVTHTSKHSNRSHSAFRPTIPAPQDDGNKAFGRGDFAAAVEHYSCCVELDATLVAARNNRAMALLKLGRWADALADCDAVLAADASNVKALLRKGQAHQELGDSDAARAVLQRALELQPENQDAKAALDRLGAQAGA